MEQIVFDGKDMTDRDHAHLIIKEKLKLPDHYGENLDALWDILSTCDLDMEIRFINTECLIENLGYYGETMLKVFKDSEKENKNIKLCTF